MQRFARQRGGASAASADNKFGTFAGVFTPTILTVLGAIMYLRLGWVVGNAGLGGAITIILLAHLITICTGLAVSSITTNTRVGAGGAFAIISQSLGLEIGGSVGVPLYAAQAISVSLYVLAFTEAWVRTFEGMPPGPTQLWLTNEWLVALATFTFVIVIALISARFAVRTQFLIMAIIGLSLVSIVLGSFPIAGQAGLVETPQLIGEFTDGNFWATFAVYFPAVTGIMSGISMSGSLRDPRRSIPVGTMAAIGVGLAVYLSLAVWLSRVAPPAALVENKTILVDTAFWDWAILAGMMGATFSSALGSIVAAPRVMQALAEYKLLPASARLAREANGEPRQATLATAIFAGLALVIALLSGGLDAVAGVLSMFFLIAYFMLNVVVLIEQTLGMVSFRPTFRISRVVPFVGMVGCAFVMFLIDPIFTVIAIVVVFGLYAFLARRNIKINIGDVRSGLFAALAEWATVRATQMPQAQERTWKPTVLVPVASTQVLAGSFRFLMAMTYPQGAVYPLGIAAPDAPEPVKDLPWLTEAFVKEGIYARAILLEEEDFLAGVRTATQVLRHTFFRPNILFINLPAEHELESVQQLLDQTAAYSMGVVLLLRHPVVELGREQLINVWVSYQTDTWERSLRAGNINLNVLLALQLARNWHGRINLCMAVADESLAEAGAASLEALIDQARLPRGTATPVVLPLPFEAALTAAPRADLNIFGLPKPSNVAFCRKIFSILDGTCVFVRDSGEESLFA